MKNWRVTVVCFVMPLLLYIQPVSAQCSICTKTAMQLGEKPAQGMNSGVLYLAFAPFAVIAYLGYRWWRNEH